MAYLKRVTPSLRAYKTITVSVLAFILITGLCVAVPEPRDRPADDGSSPVPDCGPAVISR